MKVLKDTLQHTFKFHNYWKEKKENTCIYINTNANMRTNSHMSACTHKRTYAYTYMHKYTHIYTQLYTQKRTHIHIDCID